VASYLELPPAAVTRVLFTVISVGFSKIREQGGGLQDGQPGHPHLEPQARAGLPDFQKSLPVAAS